MAEQRVAILSSPCCLTHVPLPARLRQSPERPRQGHGKSWPQPTWQSLSYAAGLAFPFTLLTLGRPRCSGLGPRKDGNKTVFFPFPTNIRLLPRHHTRKMSESPLTTTADICCRISGTEPLVNHFFALLFSWKTRAPCCKQDLLPAQLQGWPAQTPEHPMAAQANKGQDPLFLLPVFINSFQCNYKSSPTQANMEEIYPFPAQTSHWQNLP